jgi:hypothetical protein
MQMRVMRYHLSLYNLINSMLAGCVCVCVCTCDYLLFFLIWGLYNPYLRVCQLSLSITKELYTNQRNIKELALYMLLYRS